MHVTGNGSFSQSKGRPKSDSRQKLKRCGIPCSHILKITDKIEATMIKIQHWKVFHVHFGLAESKVSPKLMKGISIQLIDEDMGFPISDKSLLKANEDGKKHLQRC